MFWNQKSPAKSLFWPISAFFGCFEGMTRKKMLEIQVCGRHNLEPHLFSSFHTLIFGHKDLAQLFIPKNTVFGCVYCIPLSRCVCPSVRCSIHPFVCPSVRPSVRPSFPSFVRSFVRPFVRLFVPSFGISFLRSFLRSFVRSFVTSFPWKLIIGFL